MTKHPRKHHPILTLLALAVLAAAFLRWDNTALQTAYFDPTFSELPEGFDGCRITVLGDFHSAYFGQENERLLDAVRKTAPDYIFLVGDLLDSYREVPENYAARTADGLSAIAPVYYVTGNHEWAIRDVPALKETLTNHGVTVLSNQFLTLERNGDTVVLAGIDDPNGYADQKTPDGLAGEIYSAYDDPFWLLLAHRNNLFNGRYCRLGADLTFSGHAHGGIWRLPFTDGLVDTNLHFLPSFTSGFYRCTDEDCEGAEVFVSRGLGNSPRWAFRLFNRPQVAVITLKKG